MTLHLVSRHTAAGRSMLLAVLLALLGLCAQARLVSLTLQDERVLEGEWVAEDEQAITLRIHRVTTRVLRQEIRQVRELPSILEQYNQRRQQLAPGDLEGRYQLAYWLFGWDSFELAQHEVEQLRRQLAEAEELPAGLPERVEILAAALQKRLELERRADALPGEGPSPASAPATEALADALPRLNNQQINRIRVMEVDIARHPRVKVPREVIDDIFQKYATHVSVPKGRLPQARFRALPGWMQLDLIFTLRAREYYDRVEVVDDPPGLLRFRRDIHPLVLNYCGSLTCHGSPTAVSMPVILNEPNRVDTVYTNFYVLQTTRSPNGQVIDRDKPERSLLVQYAMPRARAYTAHPDVPGWRPLFQTELEKDELYRMVVRWLNRGLFKPTPDYGIQFPAPTTQPIPPGSAPEANNDE
ncbi:MAG: hypothetical protein IT443_07745 [Phycisphaeraceae bacterium]|nr:hypothetical protein [Phycisphaeraceae bacterium]